MADTKLENLVINKLTKAQFEASSKSDEELWFVTDEEAGAVDSVNGQTGTVVLDADDVGALPTDGGRVDGLTTFHVAGEQQYKFVPVLKIASSYNNVEYPVTISAFNGSKTLGIDSDLYVDGSITPQKSANQIGSALSPWWCIHALSICNNADITQKIAIPTTAGTMALLDDTSTTSTAATWSASKLNTTIGNIESLLANI